MKSPKIAAILLVLVGAPWLSYILIDFRRGVGTGNSIQGIQVWLIGRLLGIFF